MKRSKKLLMELTNVKLPVIRKELQPVTESMGIKFEDIKPGDLLELPKDKKKYIVVGVYPFSGALHYVEFKGDVRGITKKNTQGALIAKGGFGAFKPIEG